MFDYIHLLSKAFSLLTPITFYYNSRLDSKVLLLQNVKKTYRVFCFFPGFTPPPTALWQGMNEILCLSSFSLKEGDYPRVFTICNRIFCSSFKTFNLFLEQEHVRKYQFCTFKIDLILSILSSQVLMNHFSFTKSPA